jgi:hypothetical protein
MCSTILEVQGDLSLALTRAHLRGILTLGVLRCQAKIHKWRQKFKKEASEATVARPSTGVPVNILQTLISFVRPFQLHSVLTEFFCFPGADVANFAIGIVVPALARNGIGDGFA